MAELKPSTQQLINNCQGLVRTLAWKIHIKLPKSVDLEDLVSYGQIGLAEAARDFDAGRGGQFTTYAYHRIRGAILDGLSKMTWFNHSDFYSGKYEARRERNALGRRSRPQRRQNFGRRRRLVPHRHDPAGGGASALPGLARWRADGGRGPRGGRPPAELIRNEVAERLRKLIDDLPSDARSLIRSTYFDGLSLKEAGEQIGISKAWASRLHAKALGQLARSLVGAARGLNCHIKIEGAR